MVQRGVPEENGTTTAGAAEDMRKVWDGAPCEPAQVVLGGVQEASGASTPTVIVRISLQSDHPFRSNPISRFGCFRSPAREAVSALT